MTGHARETTMLWDSFEMTLPIRPTTDNEICDDDDTTDNMDDPYKEFDLCPICEEGLIGTATDMGCPICDFTYI